MMQLHLRCSCILFVSALLLINCQGRIPHAPLPLIRTRHDLPMILEAAKFTTGAELGVQRGLFSKHMLQHWPSARKYYLIDAWKHQTNYLDGANVDDDSQNAIMNEAKQNLAEWPTKTAFIRNFTNQAVRHIPEHLDFIYVDARHDYCGVMQDLCLYWPLLKPGGIMAGHDFMNAGEVKQINPGEDWSVCQDGSSNEGSVKGAVEEFFQQRGLQVLVTYAESAWHTWYVRKPRVPHDMHSLTSASIEQLIKHCSKLG